MPDPTPSRSRLTSVAEPGTLLAVRATSAAAVSAANWRAVGERVIRSFEHPIAVSSAA